MGGALGQSHSCCASEGGEVKVRYSVGHVILYITVQHRQVGEEDDFHSLFACLCVCTDACTCVHFCLVHLHACMHHRPHHTTHSLTRFIDSGVCLPDIH